MAEAVYLTDDPWDGRTRVVTFHDVQYVERAPSSLTADPGYQARLAAVMARIAADGARPLPEAVRQLGSERKRVLREAGKL